MHFRIRNGIEHINWDSISNIVGCNNNPTSHASTYIFINVLGTNSKKFKIPTLTKAKTSAHIHRMFSSSCSQVNSNYSRFSEDLLMSMSLPSCWHLRWQTHVACGQVLRPKNKGISKYGRRIIEVDGQEAGCGKLRLITPEYQFGFRVFCDMLYYVSYPWGWKCLWTLPTKVVMVSSMFSNFSFLCSFNFFSFVWSCVTQSYLIYFL